MSKPISKLEGDCWVLQATIYKLKLTGPKRLLDPANYNLQAETNRALIQVIMLKIPLIPLVIQPLSWAQYMVHNTCETQSLTRNMSWNLKSTLKLTH